MGQNESTTTFEDINSYFKLCTHIDFIISKVKNGNYEYSAEQFNHPSVKTLPFLNELLTAIYMTINNNRIFYTKDFAMLIANLSETIRTNFIRGYLLDKTPDTTELYYYLHKDGLVTNDDILELHKNFNSKSFLFSFAGSGIDGLNKKMLIKYSGDEPIRINYPKNSPEYYIMKDNKPDFIKNTKVISQFNPIKSKPYETRFFDKADSYLELSCYAGAKNCFDVILKHPGATLFEVNNPRNLVAAICGGNINIVQNLRRKDQEKIILSQAIKSHQHEVFNTIWKDLHPDEKSAYCFELFVLCYESISIYCFDQILSDKNLIDDREFVNMQLSQSRQAYKIKRGIMLLFPIEMPMKKN